MSARSGIVCYDANLLGCRRIKRPLRKKRPLCLLSDPVY